MVAYLILILVAIYFVWIVFMVMSWHTTKPYREVGQTCNISVIVPFRNEAKNMTALCHALKTQEITSFTHEIIFVNDHSTDGSQDMIDMHLPHRLIHLVGNNGKKKAIEEGVLASKYDVIITMDADVIPSNRWLATVSDAMQSTGSDLMILPVEIHPGYSVMEKLQSLEFMSITGITGGTAMLGDPIMCNGANLAFKKSSWMDAHQKRSDGHLASGDDMFLLHAVKKNNKVTWLHHREAVVETAALKSWSEFFAQRIRWSSKSKFFKDPGTLWFGALFMSIQVILIGALILALTKSTTWATFGWVFLFKTIADFLLLHAVTKWAGKKWLLMYFPLLVLIHPLYVITTTMCSLVYRPVWKERKI